MTLTLLRAVLGALLVSALITTAGCSSSGGGSNRGGRSGGASGGRNRTAMPEPRTADEPSRGDRRVILVQGANDLQLVMVNRGHSWLRSKEGQLALALNQAENGYKILDEAAMQQLLDTFEAKGLNALSSPWENSDDRYLRRGQDGASDVKGVLFIEDNGVRRKVVGVRPEGRSDAGGIQRYSVFVEGKAAFALFWETVSKLDFPGAGASVLP